MAVLRYANMSGFDTQNYQAYPIEKAMLAKQKLTGEEEKGAFGFSSMWSRNKNQALACWFLYMYWNFWETEEAR